MSFTSVTLSFLTIIPASADILESHSTSPVPFASNTKLPLLSTVVIVLPWISTLSTSKCSKLLLVPLTVRLPCMVTFLLFWVVPTTTDPVPFGLRLMLVLSGVVLIIFPSNLRSFTFNRSAPRIPATVTLVGKLNATLLLLTVAVTSFDVLSNVRVSLPSVTESLLLPSVICKICSIAPISLST